MPTTSRLSVSNNVNNTRTRRRFHQRNTAAHISPGQWITSATIFTRRLSTHHPLSRRIPIVLPASWITVSGGLYPSPSPPLKGPLPLAQTRHPCPCLPFVSVCCGYLWGRYAMSKTGPRPRLGLVWSLEESVEITRTLIGSQTLCNDTTETVRHRDLLSPMFCPSTYP